MDELVTVVSRATNKYNGEVYPPGTEFDCEAAVARSLARGGFAEIVDREVGYSEAVQGIVEAMTIKQIKAALDKKSVVYDRTAKKMELAEELAATGFSVK